MDSLNEEFGSLVGTENSAEDLATKHATNNEISKFHFTTATLAVLALCCGCLFVGSNYWDKQMWTSSTTDLLSDSVNDPVFQKSSTPPRHNEKWHGIISLAEKSANVCDFSWEKHLPPVIAESMDFLICKVEGKKTICALDRELKKKLETDRKACKATETQCAVIVGFEAEEEDNNKICVPAACKEDLKNIVQNIQTTLLKHLDSEVPDPDQKKPHFRVEC